MEVEDKQEEEEEAEEEEETFCPSSYSCRRRCFLRAWRRSDITPNNFLCSPNVKGPRGRAPAPALKAAPHMTSSLRDLGWDRRPRRSLPGATPRRCHRQQTELGAGCGGVEGCGEGGRQTKTKTDFQRARRRILLSVCSRRALSQKALQLCRRPRTHRRCSTSNHPEGRCVSLEDATTERERKRAFVVVWIICAVPVNQRDLRFLFGRHRSKPAPSGGGFFYFIFNTF